MSLGNRLEDLIKIRNRNVNELASKIDISASTIYSIIKRNNTKIDLDILQKIADELGVTFDYFINDSYRESSFDAIRENTLIQKYRALDERGKETVDTILDLEYNRLHTQEEPKPYLVAAHHTTGNLTDEEKDEIEEAIKFVKELEGRE